MPIGARRANCSAIISGVGLGRFGVIQIVGHSALPSVPNVAAIPRQSKYPTKITPNISGISNALRSMRDVAAASSGTAATAQIARIQLELVEQDRPQAKS